MRHFIAYHSVQRMGYAFETTGELSFLSKKLGLLKRAVGNTVWVVQGSPDGKKTAYTLCGAYLAASVSPESPSSGTYVIRGNPIIEFVSPVSLNEFSWFTSLLKSQSNFSLGFNRLNDESVIRALVALQTDGSEPLSSRPLPVTSLFDAVQLVVPTLTESQRRVLEAFLFSPHYSASAGQLRTILGLAAIIQVNGAMGQLGKKIHAVLGAHPDGLLEGEYEWWHVLATGEHTKGRGFVWTLRKEIVRGLIACGLNVSRNPMPDEVIDSEKLIEGAVRQVTVNAYERNPVARARCIEAHGSACVVCKFDFGTTYGESAVGYIHVHHLRALASIGEQYEVDPVADLRPVCPNCHAVIHMTFPPRSIEEIKAMFRL